MIRLNEFGEIVANTKVIVLAPGSRQVSARGSIIRHIKRAGNQLFYSITGQNSLIPADRVRVENKSESALEGEVGS